MFLHVMCCAQVVKVICEGRKEVMAFINSLSATKTRFNGAEEEEEEEDKKKRGRRELDEDMQKCSGRDIPADGG